MKKLLLLSALLIFTCSSGLFAQDYMKMSKKQLRIEHLKKINLTDSLSEELSLSSKKSQNLQGITIPIPIFGILKFNYDNEQKYRSSVTGK